LHRTYGLTHFKIKLWGDAGRDLDRLRGIADVIWAERPRRRLRLHPRRQRELQGDRAVPAPVGIAPDGADAVAVHVAPALRRAATAPRRRFER
jgi:hypothetical protein